MASAIRYIHYLQEVGEYETLTLQVTTDEGISPHPTLSFDWQRDRNGADRGWYGFHVKVDAQDDLELDDALSLLRRIRGRDALSFYFRVSPGDFAARLSALRAIECVYDGRESAWVPLADVKPASEKPWRDDYHAMGRNSCTVGCLAPDERTARKRIMLAFAELVNSGGYGTSCQKVFADWIAQGQPVTCIANSWGFKVPDVTSLSERIGSPEAQERMAAD